MAPLENLIVLEFCQYMSGPSAGLRMADLGAKVIKIERPVTGEGGRQLAIKNLFSGKNSVLFHTINRHKLSYSADLKNQEDLDRVKKLISKADVLIHNFRPGVMEKLGLGYADANQLNPKIIYGIISGYGTKGPWRNKPGQDLLLQSVSGLTWLSGDKNDPPVPFGISIADYMCGTHLVQGILAALIARSKTKKGMLVEVNLLSSLVDFQFEVITTHLNDGGQLPSRALSGNAHAYLSAPYGIYATSDGHLAIAMENLQYLMEALSIPEIEPLIHDGFQNRDQIMASIGRALKHQTTKAWLAIFEPADLWCAEVLDYDRFTRHEGFQVVEMEQEMLTSAGDRLKTTRCPIRIDGKQFRNASAGPEVGQHNETLNKEFQLI